MAVNKTPFALLRMQKYLILLLICLAQEESWATDTVEPRFGYSMCGEHCLRSVYQLMDRVNPILKQLAMCNAESNPISSKAHIDKILTELQKIAGISKGRDCVNKKLFRKIGAVCYHIDKNKNGLEWIEAVQKCAEIGGHLLHLQNEEQWKKLRFYLQEKDNYWTDIKFINDENWYSLTTGHMAPFMNTNPTTATPEEKCMQLSDDHVWKMNPANCESKNNFVCQEGVSLYL